jgi:hypothetical protein
VRRLVGSEPDKRVQIWARGRLGGERGVELAREYRYNNGAGVTLRVRRLEEAAELDRELRARLEALRKDALCKV